MITFIDTKELEVQENSPFPDGQPHVKVTLGDIANNHVIIKARLVTPLDLFRVGLVKDILDRKGVESSLSILYLCGARMDRAISENEPFTLKLVCDYINMLKFKKVYVFCPHSKKTGELLHNFDSNDLIEQTFYDMSILKGLLLDIKYKEMYMGNDGKEALRRADDFSIVFPDKGCRDRMAGSDLVKWYPNAKYVTLDKNRIEATGKIEGMKIVEGEVKETCFIIDDLCDGGMTFKFASEILRTNGAKNVYLVVCHAVLSKGINIPGVDHIFTTNSFTNRVSQAGLTIVF